MSVRHYLLSLYELAVKTSQPATCVPAALKQFDPTQRVCIAGAGKAAADMAAEAYAYFGDNAYGKVVTRYGYDTRKPTGNIEVLLAAHPVPDANSERAGQALLKLVAMADKHDPVLFLISGGGSALACVPAAGISLDEKLKLHQFLLRSGASIEQINTVRKHVSAIKGGRLAAQCSGPMTTLAISDVVGDSPQYIASGMTVADTSTPADALAILKQFQWPEGTITHYLEQAPALPEVAMDYQIIANAEQAIDAARTMACKDGWNTAVISTRETGEASQVAKEHAKIAKSYAAKGEPFLLFSGGELTVTMGQATGEGGPNQEYLMTLAHELNGVNGVTALAADTDGVDGSRDVAGAIIDDTTLSRAAQMGLDIHGLISNHDSFAFFDKLKDHISIGPTRTNVNDFRVICVQGNA